VSVADFCNAAGRRGLIERHLRALRHALLKHAVALAKPALERPSVVRRSLTMQH
jgi:hypothetical protein